MHALYIGLDVHKTSIAMATAFTGNEPPKIVGSCSSNIDRFIVVLGQLLKTHGLEREQVRLCYEAGPCGFVLARHLLRLGYAVDVVAPSLIPSKPGERVKTDRRDARKLARLLRSGDLTAVHIPDVADEVIRDLCRARTDAMDDHMRSQQRLSALLLRNGFHYQGKSAWTEGHMRYLRELVLQDPVQKLVLEEYLQGIDRAADRVQRLEEQMQLRLATWTRRPLVEALQGLRGFQLVASMVVASEIGDFSRFDHPRQLMAYLGLVPSEHSSSTRRRQGAITKCGNSHTRWMLVEVSHHYRLPPKVSKELSRRQEGLSREVRELSWRAQHRLNRRFMKLTLRGVHYNKVVVAIARELAAFIWELALLVDREQAAKRSVT
jgi:transposase